MFKRFLVGFVSILPTQVVWIFSKKYIAGKTLEDALKVSEKLNAENIHVTIDLLGEFQEDKETIEANYRKYVEIIEQADEQNLQTTFSVKPTMFDLLNDFELCYRMVEKLVILAKKNNRMVRLDMEDSRCTDKEIELFLKLREKYPANIGIVIQACLHRTSEDLNLLNKYNTKENPINIRLCKGIYVEPEDIAYAGYQSINNHYVRCLDYMIKNGFYCAIATHDGSLVTFANNLIEKNSLTKNQYEFQMLYGVKPKLRNTLVKQGHTVRVYVPFGDKWFSYSIRRLRENPQMTIHILKSLFGIK